MVWEQAHIKMKDHVLLLFRSLGRTVGTSPKQTNEDGGHSFMFRDQGIQKSNKGAVILWSGGGGGGNPAGEVLAGFASHFYGWDIRNKMLIWSWKVACILALENGYECFVCYHKRNITIENASKYNKEKHHLRYLSSFISLEQFPFSQTLSKRMIKAWNYILGIHHTPCICLWTSIPNFWLFLTKLQSTGLVITSDNKLWMNA